MLNLCNAKRRLWWLPLLVSLGACAYLFNTAVISQHECDAAHRRASGYYQLLLNSPHPLVMLDPDGLICEWNCAAEELLGWTHKEAIGKDPAFLMTGDGYKHREAIARRIKYDTAKSVYVVSCNIVCRGGGTLPVQVIACSVKNGRGYYHVALISLQDNVKSTYEYKETRNESS